MYSSYKILNLPMRPIGNPEKYKFPSIGKPKLYGGFRLSPEGFFEFERNSNNLIFKQIIMPADVCVPFPLSVNSKDILHRKQKSVNAKSERAEVNADVICSRDILQLFMCAPYELQNNWTVAVTRYRNTIYISQVKNIKADSLEKGQLIRDMEASWMRQLEKHCILAPTETSGECHGVFLMDICGLKVVFNAPLITETSTTCTDLRLRLDTMSRLEWDDHKRYDLIKWWTSCFLVGNNNIYVALRDDDANVHRIQKMQVRELYKGQDFWAPSVCANALTKILEAIKNMTIERNLDCPNTVILFEFNANQGQIIYRTVEKRSPYTFVGDWYRNMLNNYTDNVIDKQLTVQKPK